MRTVVVFFGTHITRTVLAQVVIECDFCGVRAEQRVLCNRMQRIVFFVPVRAARLEYQNECAKCARHTAITEYHATHAVDWARIHRQ